MSLTMKASSLLFLLLFVSLSTGTVYCSGIRVKTVLMNHKGEMQVNSRKLLALDAVLDYDYAGPNPKHDPRGKKGGGGKNP
ncbi:uncharacterized protein LOC111367714 [Olea europaea var. sylvestris]|uniref:uncharacterized protein LOC111367714 n=1 Tax=Olea europaea var. sylvestris TaxID=158386 RepID=UPI000C1D14BC|nr:uncharacterized protein LOC111367714 [Olea europaea var. sylvestris]